MSDPSCTRPQFTLTCRPVPLTAVGGPCCQDQLFGLDVPDQRGPGLQDALFKSV
ncbi:GM12916 [Drosophila sechellia]|uniref:GD21554 n=2 Tax=melanogaster subgroup TaxID=32351 RepID=B4R2C0_DROSI|nr:GM12916 [Drosophila sechellia]EDX15076.1 GD21554 [Drosophila simulans]